MMEREREWREGARAKAKADIAEATKHLKELETQTAKWSVAVAVLSC